MDFTEFKDKYNTEKCSCGNDGTLHYCGINTGLCARGIKCKELYIKDATYLLMSQNNQLQEKNKLIERLQLEITLLQKQQITNYYIANNFTILGDKGLDLIRHYGRNLTELCNVLYNRIMNSKQSSDNQKEIAELWKSSDSHNKKLFAKTMLELIEDENNKINPLDYTVLNTIITENLKLCN